MVISDNLYENTGYVLRNLNKSATQPLGEWVSGTGYGFYGTTLESPTVLNHYYYQRYTYKFTTTNQSPTWVNYYFYGGMQGGAGKSGGLTANTEYTISGINQPGMGAGNSPYSMTIYNGESNAISGVTSYVKDVMVYDVTDLFNILRIQGVVGDISAMKTWCDNNLMYVRTGIPYDIGELTVALPEEYQKLSYIETTGTQYINTGIVFDANAASIKINFTASCASTSGNQCFAGCGNSVWNGPVMLNFCGGYMEFGCSGYTRAGTYTVNTKNVYYINFDKTNQTGYQNGAQFLAVSKTYAGSTSPLHLFCFGTAGSAQGSTYFSGKLYGMSIYDSTGIRAHYVPCKRISDSVIGLYDTVNNVFKTNNGSGSFGAGSVLTSPKPILKFRHGSILANEVIEPAVMQSCSSNSGLANDPWFDTSIPVSVYNNQSNGTVTHTRVSAISQDSPYGNEHPYVLKIKTEGTASPYAGGFVASHTSAANKVFLEKFIAKVPIGWNVTCHYNSQGTGASVQFITPTVGTGDWEEYAVLYRCGSSGSFSTGGHIALLGNGSGKNLIPWEIDSDYWTISDYQSRTYSYIKNGVARHEGIAGNTSDTGLQLYSKGNITLSANTTYTLSFDVRSNSITSLSPRNSDWGFCLQNGSTRCLINSAISFAADGEWHRVSATITTGSATSYYVRMSVEEDVLGSGKYVEFRNPMLSTSTDITYRAYDSNNRVTWYLAYANNSDVTNKEELIGSSVLLGKTSTKNGKLYSSEFNTVNIISDWTRKQTDIPSSWYIDTTDMAGNGKYSIVQPVGASAGFVGPAIPIDPMNQYKISYWVKCKQDMTSFLTAICYDATEGGARSGGWNHSAVVYKPGTKTVLTAALTSGATQMTVESNSNWSSYSYSRLGFRSSRYNRSYNDVGTSHGYNGSTGLVKGTSGSNIVTFNTAYSGNTIPAGTCVVESFDGGTWPYPIQKGNLPTDNTWKYCEGYFGSQDSLWEGNGTGWSAIPAQARYMAIYINIYTNDGTVPIKWSDIRVTPVNTINGCMSGKVKML